jgi:tRNA nucleotidyltransferase (CCA-adding enzyme)
LAVDGDDLLRIGFKQGREIGEALALLLDAVIADELPNEREELLRAARSRLRA